MECSGAVLVLFIAMKRRWKQSRDARASIQTNQRSCGLCGRDREAADRSSSPPSPLGDLTAPQSNGGQGAASVSKHMQIELVVIARLEGDSVIGWLLSVAIPCRFAGSLHELCMVGERTFLRFIRFGRRESWGSARGGREGRCIVGEVRMGLVGGGSAICMEGGREGMSWGEMGEERMSDCAKHDTNGIAAKCKWCEWCK